LEDTGVNFVQSVYLLDIWTDIILSGMGPIS